MCEKLSNEKVRLYLNSNYSVERKNQVGANKLGWNWTDVLYSFRGLYLIGLKIFLKRDEKNSCANLKKIWKESHSDMNSHQHEYSAKFLSEFITYYENSKLEKESWIANGIQELNNLEPLGAFINLYRKIGNVYPIWPGGNEHRGKKGCYDVPDIYFGKKGIKDFSYLFYSKYAVEKEMFIDTIFVEEVFNSKYANMKLLELSKKEFENFLENVVDVISRRENIITEELKQR